VEVLGFRSLIDNTLFFPFELSASEVIFIENKYFWSLLNTCYLNLSLFLIPLVSFFFDNNYYLLFYFPILEFLVLASSSSFKALSLKSKIYFLS